MKRFYFAVFGIGLFLWVSPAWGDAMIESTFKTGGIKGAGASEGTSIRRYQGEKMADTVTSKFTGAILSRVMGASESLTITRVDKGVYWNIDSKNRAYTETPIQPFDKKETPGKEPEEKGKSKTRVTKSEFTVKKTGAAETINGFPCEEYLLTWLLEMEDIESKAKSQSTMTTNLWTTPETATIRKAQAEEQEFHKAYARKLGITLSAEEGKRMGTAAFAAISGAPADEIEKGFGRVKNEMSKIKGYPIRTIVTWTWEGEKGAVSKPGEPSPGESVSGLAEGVKGLLGGLMGRVTQKKAEEKPASSSGKEAPFFSSTMEIKTISTDKVPAEDFEIPAGYAKQ